MKSSHSAVNLNYVHKERLDLGLFRDQLLASMTFQSGITKTFEQKRVPFDGKERV